MSDYFSTQGWVYIAVSIILTIISLALNVYLEGPGLYLIAYFVYLFVILLTAYNITCLTKGECYVELDCYYTINNTYDTYDNSNNIHHII